jgi:hypothetical protein
MNEIITLDENYVSTTILAKNFGIKNTKGFIEYLENISLLLRDENNKLLLSQEAIEQGAKYKISQSGKWVVWPKESLKSYLQDFIDSEMSSEIITTNKNEINSFELLTPSQKKIFKNITKLVEEKVTSVLKSTNIQDYMLSLKGPAGTGKTFLTAQLAKYFKLKKDSEFDFVLTSPTHKATGVAAQMLRENKINASCRTIHSFLGIKPFRDYEKGIETFKIDKTKKEKDSTSILFVDESSMIGAELFEYIVEAIEDQRVNFVIFVGDPYQLLPVNDTQNMVYSLHQQFELTEVVRQAKDSYVLQVATALRERIQNQSFLPLDQFFLENHNEKIQYFHNQDDFIKDYHKNEKWYKEDKIIATYKNQNVDSFNKILRTIFWEQKGVYSPPTLRTGDMLRFKEAYSPNDISLYHNGQVIQLQSANLKYHEHLEIEFWECKAVDASDQQIFRVVDPDSHKVYNDKLSSIAKMAQKASFPENKKLWKTYYMVKDMFAHVQYIHASTIHKLQGSTHDTTYIDLFSMAQNKYMSDDEKYRLTYVAVTRARHDIKIFMSHFNKSYQYEPTTKQINMKQEFDNIDNMLKDISF